MIEPDQFRSSRPSRREFVALGIGAFVVATLPLARRRRVAVQRTVPAMGTVVEIAVVHRDERYAHAAIDAAVATVVLVEDLMTRFRASSDVGRANAGAAKGPVLITRETATVLREALAWAEASEGAFDPGIGRVVGLWDVGHRHLPPPPPHVARLAGRRFYRSLVLDTWTGRPMVRFLDEEVQIDLGGIAKGYAVDRAVETLRAWGIRDALVNAGGDLYALGESQDGDPWHIGIRSAEDPDRITTSLELSDGAVATSGDYFQYFEYRGRRYHHLLDPTNAEPHHGTRHTISVAADTCMNADAAATAVFGMTEEEARRLLRIRGNGARIVQTA